MTPTNEQYREAARQHLGRLVSHAVVHGGMSPDISVPERASVQPVREDGAFVEVVLWIPSSEVRK